MFQNGSIAAPLLLIVTLGISLMAFRNERILDMCLFRPYQFWHRRKYDTIVLSGFVHADMGHLLINLLTFYFFAFPLERTIGTIPFLILYFFGLILSHFCTLYKHHNNPGYASLGASGAISAVLFAFICYYPTSMIYLFFAIPVPALIFAFVYVGYSYYESTQNRGRINHDAHLCGAISGLMFVAITNPGVLAKFLS